MKKIKYNSFAEIDRALAILKIESEISRQRIILEVGVAKANLVPKNIVSDLIESFIPNFIRPYRKIIVLVLPFIAKWIKKRG